MNPNRKVLVARSSGGNSEMLEKLASRGIEASSVETIRLVDPEDWSAVDGALAGSGRFDWIVFTSPRGVSALERRLDALSIDPAAVRASFAAVGSRTASALKVLGIKVSFVPDEFLTSALGKGLPRRGGSKVLLLRADIADRELVSILESRGFEVTDIPVYKTEFVSGPVDSELIAETGVVVFASPSEVEGFRRRLGGGLAGVANAAAAACIGPVTARAARSAGFSRVEFAGEHTTDALASKVEELLVHA